MKLAEKRAVIFIPLADAIVMDKKRHDDFYSNSLLRECHKEAIERGEIKCPFCEAKK